MVRFTVTLPDAHYDALLAEAKRSGKQVNQVLQECLERAELIAPQAAPPPAAAVPQAVPETPPPRGKGLPQLIVLDKNTYQELGYLGDISREGLLLVAKRPLPLDRSQDVVIKLPGKTAFESRSVELQIEARWNKRDPAHPDLYSIGCEVARIAAADMELLIKHSSRLDLSAGEKRDTRTNLVFYLNVLDRASGKQLGHVGDISAHGFLLIAGNPLPLGRILDIRIQLPELEEFPRQYIDLEVETRWAKPDVNPDLHCTGCLFVHITPEDAALVGQVQDVLGLG